MNKDAETAAEAELANLRQRYWQAREVLVQITRAATLAEAKAAAWSHFQQYK